MHWKAESGNKEWVLEYKGKPLRGDVCINKQWSKIKKQFNFPDNFQFKNLRKTFSSTLLGEGADSRYSEYHSEEKS